MERANSMVYTMDKQSLYDGQADIQIRNTSIHSSNAIVSSSAMYAATTPHIQ